MHLLETDGGTTSWSCKKVWTRIFTSFRIAKGISQDIEKLVLDKERLDAAYRGRRPRLLRDCSLWIDAAKLLPQYIATPSTLLDATLLSVSVPTVPHRLAPIMDCDRFDDRGYLAVVSMSLRQMVSSCMFVDRELSHPLVDAVRPPPTLIVSTIVLEYCTFDEMRVTDDSVAIEDVFAVLQWHK